MMQSLLPALYPMLKSSYQLSFAQIGLLTFTFQFTASLLQPLIGAYADRKPRPYSLAAGMGFTLRRAGAARLRRQLRAAAARGRTHRHRLLGLPPGILARGAHGLRRPARPARSRYSRWAATSAPPPVRCWPPSSCCRAASRAWRGSPPSRCWASFVLFNVGHWYKAHGITRLQRAAAARPATPRRHVALAITVLLALIFSKYFYLASLTSYYTFYLIDHFHVSVRNSQLHLFVFLAAAAAGRHDRRAARGSARAPSTSSGPRYSACCPSRCCCRTPTFSGRRAHRADRPDSVVGVSGDRGVCAGPAAGAHRHGRGPVLRSRVRHGQRRSRRAGRRSRITSASRSCTSCAPSCRSSGCWPPSCRICTGCRHSVPVDMLAA